MAESQSPAAPDPYWPKYGKDPFPAYRFVPGRAPHPRRDPLGHSYGTPEPKPPPPDPEKWKENALYLHGIDLYNYAYWWECHEALEALWHAAGHESPTGQFLQGIIQVSAANLKRFMGLEKTSKEMALAGLARHEKLPVYYMGVNLTLFARETRDFHDRKFNRQAMIRLAY